MFPEQTTTQKAQFPEIPFDDNSSTATITPPPIHNKAGIATKSNVLSEVANPFNHGDGDNEENNSPKKKTRKSNDGPLTNADNDRHAALEANKKKKFKPNHDVDVCFG